MDDYKFELTTPTVIRPPVVKEKDIIGDDGFSFEVIFGIFSDSDLASI